MLTKKQHELLLFIDLRLKESGVAPSFDEMKDALGLKSKSGIHRLIRALEERGFIRRLPHRARALEVTRIPEITGRPATDDQNSRVIQGDFKSRPRRVPDPQPAGRDATGREFADSVAEVLDIPMHGRIAAGTPIEALQQYSTIPVPSALLTRGEHYALEVAGDSMIDAGIFDGDTVLIRRCDNAENGDIVVALVDDVEATLKTLHKRGAQVALEPANRTLETQIYPAGKVKIQGRLVGLLRRY
ncbi:transcriptional repressor LexA [Govanella unica]|uniref:LexA repressor n=1 Tax=Govanella unica TaxID=2975056 RepID=A0A9X3Z744_9PROT|nr:transcriptional repressor LexA [Govania unica]MDA5193786.1 transcriptional repressor LexA [Govania unica]